MSKEINKDFYDYLPSMICEWLDDIILEYKDKNWFYKAWEEYREHILKTDKLEQRTPPFVFGKYIKGEKENGN